MAPATETDVPGEAVVPDSRGAAQIVAAGRKAPDQITGRLRLSYMRLQPEKTTEGVGSSARPDPLALA